MTDRVVPERAREAAQRILDFVDGKTSEEPPWRDSALVAMKVVQDMDTPTTPAQVAAARVLELKRALRRMICLARHGEHIQAEWAEIERCEQLVEHRG